MSSNARIAGIDAARGCAMALVCLSHVKEQFVDSIPPLNAALTAVTRVATPTFLLLSGFVIAHLLESSRQRRIGLSLIDRGLFLLIVAHLLLNWNELLELGLTQWLFGRAVITDAIGISLCVAVLVRRASAGALLIGGASIALLSWPIALTLSVDSPAAALLGSVLFSLQSEENPAVDVALVPYLGLFLIGMGLSRRSADALAARDSRALARALIVPGLAAMAIVLAIAWLWHVFHHVAFDATDPYVVDLLRQTVDPRSKWPPSPAYLLFYGGAGLVMAATLLYLEPLAKALVGIPATIGRASLMAFVVQDWLLRFAPLVLGFDEVTSLGFWSVYLAGVLLLLFWLARRWDAVQGNRFLTIGLKALARGEGNSPVTGSIISHGDQGETGSTAARRRADAGGMARGARRSAWHEQS